MSLAWSKLKLCSANHRTDYFSNLACDWLSIGRAYSKQTENGPRSSKKHINFTIYLAQSLQNHVDSPCHERQPALKDHLQWLLYTGFIAPWASYQIRKIAGCAWAGNAGKVYPRGRLQRKPLVSNPDVHHGTCMIHVPWCMSGSLTRGGRENVPGIHSAYAPASLPIWQEAHELCRWKARNSFSTNETGPALNMKNIFAATLLHCSFYVLVLYSKQ